MPWREEDLDKKDKVSVRNVANKEGKGKGHPLICLYLFCMKFLNSLNGHLLMSLMLMKLQYSFSTLAHMNTHL